VSNANKLTLEAAIARFRDGRPAIDSEPTSELDAQLRTRSVGLVAVGLTETDYKYSDRLLDEVLAEHPDFLAWSQYDFNDEGVPEDGHVRKELDWNEHGQQKSDPKDLIQINDSFVRRWKYVDKSQFSAVVNEYVATMIDFRQEITQIAFKSMMMLSVPGAYEGMSEFAFPDDGTTAITTRHIRYDAHDPALSKYHRAKEHEDRGTFTVQVRESMEGLWMKPPHLKGEASEPIAIPYDDGMSRVFFGTGINKLYGEPVDDVPVHPISPLTHGVYGPSEGDGFRYSLVTFVDSPHYDLGITSLDTQPHRKDTDKLNV
jgi:hypothetical protein